MTLYGGIEAGGTKFICAVGSGPGDIRARAQFPTTTPAATIAQVLAFFRTQPAVAAIGIGAFGPVDLRPSSPTYGYITSTPKPGWRMTDLRGPVAAALGVPVGFDTDVNVAALGERRWGAGQGLDDLVYITVGTGIGAGVLVGGQPLHGAMHPEMGHLPVPHDRAADPFPGGCPYHGDCLEGLANGPALKARWGVPGDQLAHDHPAWALEARYLAYGVASCIYMLAPQRIILGGGVMSQAHLFPLLRTAVQGIVNDYVDIPELGSGVNAYIVPPALGDNAGVLGALALAMSKRVIGN